MVMVIWTDIAVAGSALVVAVVLAAVVDLVRMEDRSVNVEQDHGSREVEQAGRDQH